MAYVPNRTSLKLNSEGKYRLENLESAKKSWRSAWWQNKWNAESLVAVTCEHLSLIQLGAPICLSLSLSLSSFSVRVPVLSFSHPLALTHRHFTRTQIWFLHAQYLFSILCLFLLLTTFATYPQNCYFFFLFPTNFSFFVSWDRRAHSRSRIHMYEHFFAICLPCSAIIVQWERDRGLLSCVREREREREETVLCESHFTKRTLVRPRQHPLTKKSFSRSATLPTSGFRCFLFHGMRFR